MKRVSYAGEAFLTTDAVADALVDLTAALGCAHKAEVVELPAVDANGRPHLVRLVIGPASQMSAAQVEPSHRDPHQGQHMDQDPDLGDAATRLHARARKLEQPDVVAVTSAPITSIFDDEDLESV